MKAKTYSPPPMESFATIRDVIVVQNALAELLEEETGYMSAMQLGKVGDLQERKLKLTGLLERYTRYIHKHPESLTQVTEEEKNELRKVAENFRTVMKTNHDKLLVARNVNNAVVKCVTEITTRKNHNSTYDARGTIIPARGLHKSFSVTLNQTV